MSMQRKSHSPELRKELALKLLKNEKHPFVSKQSQSPEIKMTRSTVLQKRKPQDHPVNSPIIEDLLRQCKMLEELVKKSKKIIDEKETKIQLLLQLLKQRENCCKELQMQSHKLMEERQILIEHITQLENQLNVQEEEEAYSQDGFQQHMTNLNDLRHFLNQIRHSNEDIPVFVDVDNMTYEQLLQLEDTIGYVNRGLTKEQIKTIPKINFDQCKTDEQLCSICQNEFQITDKCRSLPCQHLYHSKCIKLWLEKEKHCPICKQELEINIPIQSQYQTEEQAMFEQ
ncbi:unnamed protein product [Paramecium sonneborni]|uniref:RING-type domain-containing protein n=1 Tax=Paramecium sonneborni TaxID=65129 RepID=A0A8S1LKJ6_9CILI|nr:unnamed protein product [Paramecium sonneborni]